MPGILSGAYLEGKTCWGERPGKCVIYGKRRERSGDGIGFEVEEEMEKKSMKL